MNLLIIAIGAALVNNVVLSQFLGLCPFLGVSKKINTAAGMGGTPRKGWCRYRCYHNFISNLQLDLRFYLSTARFNISEYHRVHSCYRSTCSVCRNVLKEDFSGAL